MKKLLARLGYSLLIISLCGITARGQEQPSALSLYSPVERQLTGAQHHLYTLGLKHGQIAEVVVEQRGLDVVVAGSAPDGHRLIEVDTPSGAEGDEERVSS